MNNLDKAFNLPRKGVKSALSAFLLLICIFFSITLGLNKSEESLSETSSTFEIFEIKEKEKTKKIEKSLDIAPLYLSESPQKLERLEMDTSSLIPIFEDIALDSKSGLDGTFGLGLMDFEDAKLEIFEVAQLDTIPRILKRARIEYPRNMLQKGIEGEVRLLVLIDEEGNLNLEKVLFATNEYFEKSAISALKEFKYESPRKMGKKVKASFVLPIPFNISQ